MHVICVLLEFNFALKNNLGTLCFFYSIQKEFLGKDERNSLISRRYMYHAIEILPPKQAGPLTDLENFAKEWVTQFPFLLTKEKANLLQYHHIRQMSATRAPPDAKTSSPDPTSEDYSLRAQCP